MSFLKLPTATWLAASLALALMGTVVLRSPLLGAQSPVIIAPPAVDNPKTAGPPQTAVLAGGCFWGVQGVFQHVRGVQKVIAGYAGGDRASAQYETVSSGSTGHAESVQIVFDPAEVSYGQLLQIAFSVVHDPTQLNRQGPDVGSQYRSAIFFHSPEQDAAAKKAKAALDASKKFAQPVATEITAAGPFYRAEEYHQGGQTNSQRGREPGMHNAIAHGRLGTCGRAGIRTRDRATDFPPGRRSSGPRVFAARW